uniref:Reverse transcriptase domain-containing protein n=1 Tax=Tanacetum cinerariifolium TaxID=118510 RepID=A0A699I2U0_TANCI|nr:hypothetical protein [Tanacetum cinerariifolium]
MNQNFNYSNSFGFDQIQPPQQFVNHQPQEIPEVIPFIESKELIETKNELYKMMEAYVERMNQQREQEALLAAQREQELRNQEQAAQREQEILAQKQAAQEKEKPLQNSDFHQLIREICGIKASAEKKKKLEEMMLELLELCREKEFYCVHDNIKDLLGMAMNTMLISINLKSQRLDKEKHEVKNIVDHATKHKTRITESLQNFAIIHKMSSISNTSQISLVIAITPDLPTEEPEYSLSMGDEHLSTIPEIESDEVIKSSVKNLIPIPSESEFTFDNENTLIDSSPKFDYLLEVFSGELAHIDPISQRIEEADFDLEKEIRLVENLSYDNSSPRPLEELNPKIFDTILESLSLSPILVEDNESHIEEIDLFLAMDDLMPPSLKNDDYELEGDIHFLEELLSNDPLPLPKMSHLTLIIMMIHHFLVLLRNHQMLRIAPDLETSCARGFVHRPLKLQSLAYGNLIS